MDCIFCKIVSGSVPSHKIFENNEYLAFLDIANFVTGHTLVIPKKHISNIWEIREIGEYFKVIQMIGKHYINNLGFKFVDTLSFGRLVLHAHVHILPHNGDNKEYSQALANIYKLQTDMSRRLTIKQGDQSALKFKIT